MSGGERNVGPQGSELREIDVRCDDHTAVDEEGIIAIIDVDVGVAVVVDGEEGEGAELDVVFEVDVDLEVPGAATTQVPMRRGSGPVILCVDSDPFALTSLVRSVESAEFTIYGTTAVSEARRLLAETRIDTVLCTRDRSEWLGSASTGGARVLQLSRPLPDAAQLRRAIHTGSTKAA